MRTITAATQAVLDSNGRAEYCRVKVADSGGTLRDLTTYGGYNMLVSANWQESVENPHATARVEAIRDIDRHSLAPFAEDSPLNRALSPANSYAALIQVNRRFTIEIAVVPMDKTPASGDWFLVFDGRIDSHDSATDRLTFEGRDLGGALADCFIEDERVYAFGEVSGVGVSMSVFEPSTAYALGEYVLPTEARRNGHFFEVTDDGTSAATEPTWPTSSTVTSGTVEFTEVDTTTTAGVPSEEVIQNILDDWTSVTLEVPSASGWALTPFVQSRTTVLDAITTIATQRGWAVRYKYDSGSTSFKLTYYEPDRTKNTVDYEFSKSMCDVASMPVNRFDIRNVVRVVYSDASDLAADGTPKRKFYEADDSTSISAYGRLFCEIAEASSSQIDSSSEAQAMAEAALADLKDPVMEHAAELSLGFPWAELGDLYTFNADDRRYSSDQSLALFAYEHTFSEGHIKTTLHTRGKPTLGMQVWKRTLAHPAGKENHRTIPFENPTGVARTLTPVVGGVRVSLQAEQDKNAFGEEFEHHVSVSPGFTPDDTTLVAVGRQRNVEIADLTPGQTYYHVLVPRARNSTKLVRGHPSEETSFVAGSAKSQHIDSVVSPGLFPPNGAFEHAFRDLASYPPDNWEMSAGTWGTQAVAGTDGNGGRSIVLENVAGATSVKSAIFPTFGNYYNIDMTYKTTGANAGVVSFQVVVYFYKDTALTPCSTASRTHSITNASAGVWLRTTSALYRQSIGTDCNFIAIELKKSASASDYQIEVGECFFYKMDFPQETWNVPTLQNSWVDSGGSDAPWGVYHDGHDRVHLRGVIKSGTTTAATLIATLASGDRPGYSHYFPVECNGASGWIKIASNGQITIVGGFSATRSCLDGVSFRYNE